MQTRFSNKQLFQKPTPPQSVNGWIVGEYVNIDFTKANLIKHGFAPKRRWEGIVEMRIVRINIDTVEMYSGSLDRILIPFTLIPNKNTK